MGSNLGSRPPWLGSFTSWARRASVKVILPTDPLYEGARRLYNTLHDARPAVLVRCVDRGSLGKVLRFAEKHRVVVAVRGGGHHIAGFATCDRGIVIDLSPFRRVMVDSGGGTVDVEPGARLAEVDGGLCPRGFVLPTGTVSRTGIAGLTLGGGIGWLIGRYGLTCDHLIGADLVLADGQFVRAEDSQHDSLLWALRGGGGNFGVVTRFRYRLQVLPTFTTGSATVTLPKAAAALRRTLKFLRDCPPALTIAPVLRNDHGQRVLSIDFCMADGKPSMLRSFRAAVDAAEWRVTEGDDFRRWQSSFDRMFEPPMRGYWKARYGRDPMKVDAEALVDLYASAPIRRASILLEHLHGAIGDGSFETAAFPLRSARVGVLVAARWRKPEDDERAIDWVRSAIVRVDPANAMGTYSNYASHDDAMATATYPKAVADRLAIVKRTYDPGNLFSRNHNIRPAR